MDGADRQQLLKEIRESDRRQTMASPLAGFMRGWLTCEDAQAASQALARALSVQGCGDPVSPGPGIWLLPPG